MLGSHNYRHTKTWDPEGIVSTLPAIATVLFGILAGHVLRLQRTLSERTTWLFCMGNLLIGAGLICSVWLPINKKLWTDSFALFMAGLDCVMFAMFLWLIDGLGKKRVVKPLVIMGMNAITVYLYPNYWMKRSARPACTAGCMNICLAGWHLLSMRRWLTPLLIRLRCTVWLT